jgi:uncharacterized protein YdaU (DUF1376 family)
MHYYSFNIGDYASHTSGLSPTEDIIYRRLIDKYYLSETGPQGSPEEISRTIGMRDSVAEVDYILLTFFKQNSKGKWIQKRIEEELLRYKMEKESKSRAGKASGASRRRTGVEHNRTGVEQNSVSVELTNNQEPITNNHKPLTNNHTVVEEKQEVRKNFKAPAPQEVLEYANSIGFEIDHEHFVTYYTAQGWKLSNGVAMEDWQATIQNWKRREAQKLSIPTTSFVKEV